MKLVTCKNKLLECEISELFEKTEELYLQINDMIHLEDISNHPSQHLFCNLRVLNVYKCADLTYLFTIPVASGLKKLEHLTVSECPVLEVLVGKISGVGVIKFQELKFLCLEGLPKLISLSDNSVNVIELPEMVELILDGLPNFNSIYYDISNASAMQSFLNEKVNTFILILISEVYLLFMTRLRK